MLAIAGMPAAKRSKFQEELVDRYYKEHVDSAWRQAEAELAKVRKQKTDLEGRLPTVMIMEDLAKPRPTYVLKRGRYDMPDTNQTGEARRSFVHECPGGGHAPQSPGTGEMAGLAR